MATELNIPGLSDDETPAPAAPATLAEQAQQAVAEAKAEAAAWRPAPIEPPRRLAAKFGTERVEHLIAPAPFAEYWFDMRTRAAEQEVSRAVQACLRPDQSLAVYPYLAHFCTAWSLEYVDGSPVPIDGDGLELVPGQVASWLLAEWGERRRAPLATPPAPANGQTPRLVRGA